MRVKATAFCIGIILGVLDVRPIVVRAQSLPKVIIGYPANSIASIQLFIAQEKGFFREEGLYTFVRWNGFFTNPPLCITEAELAEAFAIIDKALSATDQAIS